MSISKRNLFGSSRVCAIVAAVLVFFCQNVFAAGELGKTEPLNLASFSTWYKTDKYAKDTQTVTYNGEFCGGGLYLGSPKSLAGFNYLEIDYSSTEPFVTVKVEYSDGTFDYNALGKGKNKVYVKLNQSKSLKNVVIQNGNWFPVSIKFNAMTLCEKAPAYITAKIVDKGSKPLNDSKSAMDYVKSLTIGWNMGNSLESIYYGNKSGAESQQYPLLLPFTAESDVFWSTYPASKEMFVKIKEAGFDMVRIPTTWYNHIIDNNYTIDPVWMAKVKRTVDWAIEAGLYVMLNEHHSVYNGSPAVAAYGWGYQVNKASKAESEKFLKAVWSQICTAFNNGYDEHLMFEVLNEPRDTDPKHGHAFSEYYRVTGEHCTKCKEDFEVLNSYNQVCVDTIRASGGNNAKRYLVIPALSTGTRTPLVDNFKMPKDSAKDKLILAVHDYYYSLPEEGTLKDGASSYKVSAQQKKEEADLYAALNKKFMSKGIPIILTETACHYANSKGVKIDRDVWYDFLLETLSQYGGKIIWWDNGGSYNGSIFNRRTFKWESGDGKGKYADETAFVKHLTSKAADTKANPVKADSAPAKEEKAAKPAKPAKDAGSAKAGDGVKELLKSPSKRKWSDTPISITAAIKNATADSYVVVETEGSGSIKFINNAWKEYAEGELTGADFVSKDKSVKDLYGCISFTSNSSITYKPTAAEWATMKKDGFQVIGDAKITSIKFYAK